MNKNNIHVGLAWLAGLILAGILILLINSSSPSPAPTTKALAADSPSLLQMLKSGSTSGRNDTFCALTSGPDNSCLGSPQALCATDLEMAQIAWKYFENNYNPETGLYNAADKYPSTTMWDTGSALAATISAHDFGIIDDKVFDDRIRSMFKTLSNMELFNKEAPNKVYHTISGAMVDYRNQPAPEGIGVSALDLARIISWLNTLSCMHPQYAYPAQKAIERWDLKRLIKDGQMFGLYRDPTSKELVVAQEGRLGYEQYGGKIFRELGYDQHIAATYNNEFRETINIYDVPIAYDRRDPRDLGAYNYVVTESYAMDAVENGIDAENRPLLDNIYLVQKRRWEKTGILTAVSEDNIDQKPYFLYNTIFTAGLPWNTTTDKGVRYDNLKTVSVKAALSLAILYPEDPYSKELAYNVSSAYDPERGWYSGIYESGGGYNKAITANTNGIVLSLLLHKKYGEFYPMCKRCERGIKPKLLTAKTCDVCTAE
ncbi:MAG: hypothetical protein RL122_1141 [Pseudomonadota bacterium]|jgi:hypothetical protein|uniref:DUF3131 domain-containing protein n=1 Tax=Thiothrix fructosivorans TaxID=111770 RepID=A0A8B0SQG2_9GAMM|nr:DUF3131 domain-containing protein [Thiothrix fructosivorans]MBO0613428.1 DUF3131 domain-containing protein [Thiothrix fructosivorans]QTX11142.1 DUF3131 domain-containing protein [Thiothrix fructosivorans]